ncbi:zinc-binding dehydrogenase [Agromyces neolithicus]|uniref:zinc-binding dehydrogenase n=1 Tax=Agromyces neolithicus TaxID=269420 RepID=UPI0031D8A69C
MSERLPAPVAAPASCATATAVAALDAASTRVRLSGSGVLVTGAGMIGLSATALAIEAGATVLVSEPDPARRAFAARLGAIPVDPGARGSAPERLEAALEALGGRGIPEVLTSIEASGAPAAVQTAVRVLGIGGVAVLVGSVTPGSEVHVDAEALVRRLITITAVHDYSADHLVRAVAFLERAWHGLPFDELVGTTHALAELDAALAEAATGEHVRVGVAPGRRIHR